MPSSIKLPPQLSGRVIKAARTAGKSPHAFMVEAIEQQTSQFERRQEFIATAVRAEKETRASGMGFRAEEVHAAMQTRARGLRGRRPKAKSWRK